MIDLKNPEVQFVVKAVTQASRLAREIQRKMEGSSLEKSDASPVTIADFSIQALFGHLLEKEFPKDVLVAEEDSSVLRQSGDSRHLKVVMESLKPYLGNVECEQIIRWIDRGTGKSSGRFWVLDPIDGTKGFIRGGQYAVALALIERGEVQLAALGCPELLPSGESELGGTGTLAIAVKGQGSWSRSLLMEGDFRPIKVSRCKTGSDATVLRSFETMHTDAVFTERFMKTLGMHAAPVLMDSQAKYLALACGKSELFFYLTPPANPDFRMHLWDVAPGALIVEEAGGKISDLMGERLNFSRGVTLEDNPGILVTNGVFHAKAVETIRNLLS
ncbi:MAG: 3'(2'),5'-bisphosphate nucleotidase [Candidatus Omnitrophica bacterium]|nr:3'(2'),5'-bisphosphate nucleotidase [Candidatus Omnitrophota bacterium]